MAMAFPTNTSGARRTAKTSVSSNQPCFVGETVPVSATVAQTVNTLLGSIRVPYGAEIVGIVLDCDSLDTNGSPTMTISIGDSGNDSRLLGANSVARAGGVVITPVKGAIGYQYTGKPDTLIQVKIKAAAATGQAGTIHYGVMYVSN